MGWKKDYQIIGISLITMIIGFISLSYHPHWQFLEYIGKVRNGYTEIFYPPTPAYVLTAISIIFLVAALAQLIVRYRVSQSIALIGRYSLLIYILHQMWLLGYLNQCCRSMVMQQSQMDSYFSVW